MTEERIKAAKKALEESTKLLEEGKRKYDSTIAIFEKTKASLLTSVNINLVKKEKDKAEKEVQQTVKYLNSLKDKISEIQKQLGIAVGGLTLKKVAQKQKKEKEAQIKSSKAKIIINEARSLTKKKINIVSKLAIVYVISSILSTQLNKLSKSVQRLTELVDKTNIIIQSVQTKQDIVKARIARDAALIALNNAEQQLVGVNKILKVLNIILLIFKITLFIALLYPIPTIPKIVNMISSTMMALDSLSAFLGVSSLTIEGLITEIQYQKTRLLNISDIIDKALDNNLEPYEIQELINNVNSNSNYGKLGPLDGVFYKGFTFAIYEENDPKFIVAGNKRRYAVALDRSGFIVLYSQSSFTLDPEVLVEELKTQIEKQGLEA